MDCWSFMDCPEDVRFQCPAYPGNGRDCWKMANTMCGGGKLVLTSLVEKVAFCRNCEFYLRYVSKKAPALTDEQTLGPNIL